MSSVSVLCTVLYQIRNRDKRRLSGYCPSSPQNIFQTQHNFNNNSNCKKFQQQQRHQQTKMPNSDRNDNGKIKYISFKQKKPLATRKEEVAAIRVKFPSKVPVIVEKYHKELALPSLDKTKFLVPQEITMSQFITIIRNRLQLNSQQALYLLVSNRNLASLSRPLAQIYRDYRDEDGFLYVTYASQEVFG